MNTNKKRIRKINKFYDGGGTPSTGTPVSFNMSDYSVASLSAGNDVSFAKNANIGSSLTTYDIDPIYKTTLAPEATNTNITDPEFNLKESHTQNKTSDSKWSQVGAELMTGLGGIATNVINQSNIKDTSGYKSEIDAMNKRQADQDNYNSALENWKTLDTAKNISQRELMGTKGDRAKKWLSTFTTGASMGAGIGGTVAGPIGMGVGAAIGGAVGGITGGIGNLINRIKAKKEAPKLNKQYALAEQRQKMNQNIGFSNITKNNNFNILSNTLAKGGFINTFANGGFLNKGYSYIGAGGTHEDNPNGGVQVGLDPKGIPNMVEEGEVIAHDSLTKEGDYVFSKNKLKASYSFLEKNKLPTYLAGMSYADAFKELIKDLEETANDSITKRTMQIYTQRLMRAQEQEREQDKKFDLAGAQMADQLLGTNLAQEMSAEQQNENMPINEEQPTGIEGMFAYGGKMRRIKKYEDGSLLTPPMDETAERAAYQADQEQLNSLKNAAAPPNLKYLPTTPLRHASLLGPAIGFAASAMPADYSIPNSLMAEYSRLGNFTRVKSQPIGNYLGAKYLDRNYIGTKTGQQFARTADAIRNTGNGNQSSIMAHLAAADANSIIGRGNAYIEGDKYNWGIDKDVENFNRETNKYNSQQSLQAQSTNAQLAAQAQQRKYQLLSNAAQMKYTIDKDRSNAIGANLTKFFDNLGALGKENYAMNQHKWLASTGFYGPIGTRPQGMKDADWEQMQQYNKARQAYADALENSSLTSEEAYAKMVSDYNNIKEEDKKKEKAKEIWNKIDTNEKYNFRKKEMKEYFKRHGINYTE